MIVKNLAGHGVDGISNLITVSLCDLCKAPALGEIAADDTIVTFIGTTLETGIRMGIVDRKTLIAVLVMLHAVAVLELRAIVHGDGLECALRIF